MVRHFRDWFLEQEHLRAVILDSKNHVIAAYMPKVHTVYIGSLNTAVVRVGELFREAIRLNAAAVIAAYMPGPQPPQRRPHPLTRGRPRHGDLRSWQIVEAGKLLNATFGRRRPRSSGHLPGALGELEGASQRYACISHRSMLESGCV